MVGRKWARDQVMANLRRRQNTLVIGPSGIGKTCLLRHIAAELGTERAYYIEVPSPATSALKAAYKQIGGFSDAEIKDMKMSQWNLLQLAKELIALLEGRDDFMLIIDSLDKITAASSEWLKVIAESSITLLGACRETKESKLLDRFFWTFEMLTLKPMPDKEIKEILRQHVMPKGQSQPAIRFRDHDSLIYFVERAIKSAKGIPLTAVELCKRAKGVKEVSMTFIKEHLTMEHAASLKYIDATPLLLLGLCAFAMMRYIARGMGSQDAYIFFGAFYALIMVVRLFIMRGSARRRG